MSVVDDVKSRIDIVDLVGQYVPLQRAGRNFKAPCPFHSEKTPSFIVSPERQTWHCFGACGEGGDCFNFVMKREGVEFPEALRILAQRAGVELTERRAPEEDARRNRLVEANEAAAAYYHNALRSSQAGAAARAYLTDRGLDAETIEAFELGYSPDSWDSVKSFLVGRGFSDAELLEAGLLVESDRGGYDRFRDRLMFPIRDEKGRVVGFGARKLSTGESTDGPDAKYINTPQTPMFDKGGLLYALDKAKEAIRRDRSAIVVEGYMDVIAAHQHGRTNVVASMGTALTDRQIKLLERMRAKVLLAMDADAAGIEATLRALQEAGAAGAIHAGAQSVHPALMGDEEFSEKVQEWSRNGLKRATVNFYVVPLSGKDPDEMIRADDGAWEAAIEHAEPFTEHVFGVVASRKDLSLPDQRAELLQELLPIVRLISEPTHQAHYVQRLAARARVGEKVVWQELQRQQRPRRAAEREQPATRVRRDPKEDFLLALLLRHDDLRAQGRSFSPELFLLSEHRAIFEAWQQTADMNSLREMLSEDIQPSLDRILAIELPPFVGSGLIEALESCVDKIVKDRLQQAKEASAAALSELGSEDMAAAVDTAYALQEAAGSSSASESDERTLALASALVEDDEMGRRLHRTSPATRPASPQREEDP
ncbi:MAG: DNA primase [Dehalococcoidia bacterium]